MMIAPVVAARRPRLRISGRSVLALAVLGMLLGFGDRSSWGQPGADGGIVPRETGTPASLERRMSAEFLTEPEEADLRVRFGRWTAADLMADPVHRARADLAAGRYESRAFQADGLPARFEAEAMFRRGEVAEALHRLEATEPVDHPHRHRLRAECLEWLGRFDEADAALDPLLDAHAEGRYEDDPDALVEVARGLALRARYRGEPARTYESLMTLLASIREDLDRHHWEARLVEGQVLLDKHNRGEAVAAFRETLALHPRCAEAWYELGKIALGAFDFDGVDRAVTTLRELDDDHVLADLLETELALHQGFADEAAAVLDPLLARLPRHRHARALAASLEAIRFDEPAMRRSLEAFDELSPGHPWATYVTGSRLSRRRQYDLAADLLAEAIRRAPEWPAPRIALGLLEVQAGRDDRALAVLRSLRRLDPFNAQATFSLHLLESLQSYEEIQSEHFIVRYDPETADGVLAAEMIEALEEMHDDLVEAFDHEPPIRTRIELMPDHARFAVRITGMPILHPIAASTGPVVAMETPREGPGHSGPYDWERVIRHEYVHTVTLSATANRIPHWFTEAAAVWQEPGPRDLRTVLMLVNAHRRGRLFDLDEINWAFVRPKQPGDRGQAYAQGHWMFEFLVERHGRRAMLDLLAEYRAGRPEEVAMPSALGISREQFHAEFLEWAGDQVAAWGYAPDPPLEEVVRERQWADPSVRAAMADQIDRIASWMAARVRRAMTRPVGADLFEDPDLARDPDVRRRLFPGGWPDLDLPQPDFSAETWAEIAAEWPNHPDVLLLRLEAAIESDAGINDELVPEIERYLELRPLDPRPHRWLARHHLESGAPERGVPHLRELDRREKYRGTWAVELARIQRRAGDYDEALGHAERALGIEPFNPTYRELAAAIALQAQSWERARHHLEALTRIEPDRSRHRERLDALDRLIAARAGSEDG